MTKLVRFVDKIGKGCWAGLKMDDNDPCWISVAQDKILVKKSVFGLFGAQLYCERNVYNAGNTARALSEKYPDDLTPPEMTNIVLKAFTNAVLHCSNLSEVTHVLNTAFKK